MKCEQDHCIYNEDCYCTLKNIQINSLDCCEEAIIIAIPKKDLKILKKRQRREVNSRWKDKSKD